MINDLTVAICAYNSERYILETLKCIVEQTKQDFDLLIINDCSTDNTEYIASSYLNKKNRSFKIVNFEENKGLAYGRHFVEKNIYTKYLLFIDSDDCPKKNLIEKLYTKIKSDEDLIAVGCYHCYIDDRGKRISGGIFLGAKTKEEFFNKADSKKLIFMQPTAIINREYALKVGGRNIVGFPDGELRYQDLCEDLDLWTRMSDLYIEGKAIIVIPEILNNYRKHRQGLSSSSFGMNLRMMHIKKNLLRRRNNEQELEFSQFYKSLPNKTLKNIYKKSKTGDLLKTGVIKLNNGLFFSGIIYIFYSILRDPRYFIQKIRANSQLFQLKND